MHFDNSNTTSPKPLEAYLSTDLCVDVNKYGHVVRNPVSMHLIPMVLEEGSRGERSFDIYSLLLRSRIIFLTGEIDDKLASLICAQLLYLDSSDATKPISLYINSPGGSVNAGLSIYDTMQHVKSPVATYGMGIVASAASLLLCAGQKGHRYCLPNTRVMIHQPHGGARGQASDIEIQAREILYLKKKLETIYLHHTLIPEKDITSFFDRDTFFDVQQAHRWGLIDHFTMNAEKNITSALPLSKDNI
jgi:ATP-dependent Clp protease protease subunit